VSYLKGGKTKMPTVKVGKSLIRLPYTRAGKRAAKSLTRALRTRRTRRRTRRKPKTNRMLYSSSGKGYNFLN
jgi:hypothetical protein